MNIRKANENDFGSIWPIFHEIVSEGKTYSYPVDTTKEEAHNIWMDMPVETYVIEAEGRILGTYYIKSNQTGAGSHVCNCGYMVASHARGMGLASQMCLHSQKRAQLIGYKAIQFNFVFSSNTVAIRLWQKMGFDIVGRLPRACNHPEEGYIDALVMYKWLED